MSRAEPDNDFSTLLNQNNWLNGRSGDPFPAAAIFDSMQPLNVTNAFLSSPEKVSSVQIASDPIDVIADSEIDGNRTGEM